MSCNETAKLWMDNVSVYISKADTPLRRLPETNRRVHNENTIVCDVESKPKSNFFVKIYSDEADENSGYLYVAVLADGSVIDHFLLQPKDRTVISWGWQSAEGSIHKFKWSGLDKLHLNTEPSSDFIKPKEKKLYSLRLDRWVTDGPGSIRVELFDIGKDNSSLTADKTMAVEHPKCICSYVSAISLSHHIRIGSTPWAKKPRHTVKRLPLMYFKQVVAEQPPFFTKIFSYAKGASFPDGMEFLLPQPKDNLVISQSESQDIAPVGPLEKIVSFAKKYLPMPLNRMKTMQHMVAGPSSERYDVISKDNRPAHVNGTKVRREHTQKRSPSIELPDSSSSHIHHQSDVKLSSPENQPLIKIVDRLCPEEPESEDEPEQLINISQGQLPSEKHSVMTNQIDNKKRSHETDLEGDDNDDEIPSAHQSIRANFIHGGNISYSKVLENYHRNNSPSPKRRRLPLVILPPTPPHYTHTTFNMNAGHECKKLLDDNNDMFCDDTASQVGKKNSSSSTEFGSQLSSSSCLGRVPSSEYEMEANTLVGSQSTTVQKKSVFERISRVDDSPFQMELRDHILDYKPIL